MSDTALYFIQPHVLERLLSGAFVAKRQQNKTYELKDRRNNLSPLNVTRRAIRYEYQVFYNRKEQIVQAVQALNSTEKKIVLVSGPSGRGKTSFLRGVVEMMGGGQEQLLWFDVSRHTDYDEIVRFLLDSMTELCMAAGNVLPFTLPPNPVSALDQLLRQTRHFPILLVIDNIDFLVGPDSSLRSRELKDAFNFLLSFPNVKLILAGRQLPEADISLTAQAVENIILHPLPNTDAGQVIRELLGNHHTDVDFEPLLAALCGEPYLLHSFAALFRQKPAIGFWQNLLGNADPETAKNSLAQVLLEQLPALEREIALLMSLVRHSLPFSAVQNIATRCNIPIAQLNAKQLDQGLMRITLKKAYPPQVVLDKLKSREKQQGQSSIEAHYQLSEQWQPFFQRQLTAGLKAKYHNALHDFYLQEKNKHVLQRQYQVRTRHLAAEAQHHQSRAKTQQLQALREETEKPKAISAPPEMMRFQADFPASAYNEEPETQAETVSPLPSTIPWPKLEEPSDHSSTANLPALNDDERAMILSAPAAPITLKLDQAVYQPLPMQLSETDLQKLADYIMQRRMELQANHVVDEAFHKAPEDIASLAPDELADLDLSQHHPDDAEILMRLNLAVNRHDRESMARELIHLAQARLEKNQAEQAEACLVKALSLAKEQHHAILMIKSHGMLGHLYRMQFKHNAALKHLKELDYVAQQFGESPQLNDMLALAFEDLAEIYFYRNKLAEAEAMFRRCLQLKPNDLSFKADVLFRLALALDESGKSEEAIRVYSESLEVSQMIQDNQGAAQASYNLGSLYFDLGRHENALMTLQHCLKFDERNGYPEETYRTLILLSRVTERQKNLAVASDYAIKALHLAEAISDKTLMASAYLRLGVLMEQSEAWAKAAGYYQQAQAVAGSTLSQESRNHIAQRIQSLQEHLPS